MVLLLLGWFFMGVMGTEEEAPASSAAPVAVAGEAVAQRTLTTNLVYQGTLQARAKVPIIPRANGIVDATFVEVGDFIERDDVLAVLNADEVQLQAAQAQAVLEAARASLARAEAGARPEEILQAEAGLRQAQANYDAAKASLDRSRVLYEEGVVSKAEWEAVQTQYEVATAGLRNAENALEIARQGAHPEDLRSAVAAVQQAQAAADLAALAVEHTRIKAPLAGFIAQLQLDLGMTVGAGSAVGVIVDAEKLRMPVLVGSRDVVQLRRGQAAELTVDSLPDQVLQGTVATVAPAADQASGMYSVVFEFDNTAGVVRPGMHGSVSVQVQQLVDVLTIPFRALVDANGDPYVFVVTMDNTAERRPVELGVREGTHVQILSGLDAGEWVVVVGHDALRPGTTVRLQANGEVVRP